MEIALLARIKILKRQNLDMDATVPPVRRAKTPSRDSAKNKTCSSSSLSEKFLPRKHLPQWHEYGLDEKLPLGPYREKNGGLIQLSRNSLASGVSEHEY